MDNVFNVNGTKKENIQTQNAIYQMRSEFPIVLELAKLKSEYQHERMVSLRRQGFTDEQAIEIIKVEKTPFE